MEQTGARANGKPANVKQELQMEILESIPAKVDLKELKRRLKMSSGKQWDRVLSLVEIAEPLIEPKVAYKVSYIEEKNKNTVTIDGIQLTSHVLRKQLEEVGRVFPYVLTIGPRLEKMAQDAGDYLQQYYLETIADAAIASIRPFFEEQLRSRFALEKLSRLGPGSLEAWPISEQEHLFSILGNVESAIGVRLTETFLMMPRKSTSGIYFPTETPFFACQLCPREGCPSRKAAYDIEKSKEYGVVKSADLM
jgi:hypothetical protein